MLALFVTLATASIAVRGDSLCPAAATVEEHLSGLIPNGEGWVELTASPEAIELTYWTAADVPIARRRLERAGSCSELAEASAVVIATWAGRSSSRTPLPEVSAAAPTSSPPEREHRLQPGINLGERVLLPAQSGSFRSIGTMLATTFTFGLDYLKASAGFGGRFEASVNLPVATSDRSFFAPLSVGGSVGLGPVYRFEVYPLVKVDVSAMASLSLLFANDSLKTPLFCVGGDLGASVMYGNDGIVPYLRLSGGLTHQTMVANVWVPSVFLALGVTWMRT